MIASRVRQGGRVSRSRSAGPDRRKGDFSIDGWLADVRAAVDALDARRDVTGVWIAGFRLGGTLAIVTAAGDDRVRGTRDVRRAGVAAHVGAGARTGSSSTRVERACCAARGTRPIPTRGSGRSPTSIRSMPRATSLPRPWLLVHGSADDVVPVDDARRLADAAGAGVELRIVANGAHRLRHDPRAIAALLGWLDHQNA